MNINKIINESVGILCENSHEAKKLTHLMWEQGIYMYNDNGSRETPISFNDSCHNIYFRVAKDIVKGKEIKLDYGYRPKTKEVILFKEIGNDAILLDSTEQYLRLNYIKLKQDDFKVNKDSEDVYFERSLEEITYATLFDLIIGEMESKHLHEMLKCDVNDYFSYIKAQHENTKLQCFELYGLNYLAINDSEEKNYCPTIKMYELSTPIHSKRRYASIVNYFFYRKFMNSKEELIKEEKKLETNIKNILKNSLKKYPDLSYIVPEELAELRRYYLTRFFEC